MLNVTTERFHFFFYARLTLYRSQGGNDTFISLGADSLYGDAWQMLDRAVGGDDLLVSSNGENLLFGDAALMAANAVGGADVFEFGPMNSNDVIGDFRSRSRSW